MPEKIKLSARRQAFVDALVMDIKGKNATAAAIKAGYSPKTASQAAYKLMHDDHIKAAIAAARKEHHEQNTAEADEVVEFITSVMRGEDVENIPIFVRKGKQEFKEGKPSARDRLKAAEMLGKHYGIFDGNTAPMEDSGGVVIMPEVKDE